MRRRVDRLWTRGDRFFIESSNDRYRWTWGHLTWEASDATTLPQTRVVYAIR